MALLMVVLDTKGTGNGNYGVGSGRNGDNICDYEE